MTNEWGLRQAVQYGTGTSYQAACPAFPPAPAGYGFWNSNINGSIPSAVQARAITLSNDMTKPLGYTETIYSGGVPLLLRVDAHTWTTDSTGAEVGGCYHGCEVLIPTAGVSPPASGQGTSNTLFALSIGLGAIVSVLSIYEFMQK